MKRFWLWLIEQFWGGHSAPEPVKPPEPVEIVRFGAAERFGLANATPTPAPAAKQEQNP